MYYQITMLAALVVFLGGCASTGSPEPSTEQTSQLVETTAAGTNAATTESVVDEPMGDEEAEKVASATTEQEWLCRRERLTGTHYMVKICRPRYKVDEDMRRTQENMRDMQRSASNSGPVR